MAVAAMPLADWSAERLHSALAWSCDSCHSRGLYLLSCTSWVLLVLPCFLQTILNKPGGTAVFKFMPRSPALPRGHAHNPSSLAPPTHTRNPSRALPHWPATPHIISHGRARRSSLEEMAGAEQEQQRLPLDFQAQAQLFAEDVHNAVRCRPAAAWRGQGSGNASVGTARPPQTNPLAVRGACRAGHGQLRRRPGRFLQVRPAARAHVSLRQDAGRWGARYVDDDDALCAAPRARLPQLPGLGARSGRRVPFYSAGGACGPDNREVYRLKGCLAQPLRGWVGMSPALLSVSCHCVTVFAGHPAAVRRRRGAHGGGAAAIRGGL